MVSKYIYTVGQEDIVDAVAFAETIRKQKAQSNKDFGRSDMIRGRTDFLADTFEGKLAELVFAKFMADMSGMALLPDFDIYNNPNWIDYGQDFDQIRFNNELHNCRCRIDIKATRKTSKWLLVERHKFWSDAYILVRLDLPPDLEKNFTAFKGKQVVGEIAGFAYHFDLLDPRTKKPWFGYKQGERLLNLRGVKKEAFADLNADIISKWIEDNNFPRMGPSLKSPENFGFPMKWLRNNDDEWRQFFDWIQESLLTQNNNQVANLLG